MTQVDQFESVFKSASREIYDYLPFQAKRVLVVSDLQDDDFDDFANHCRNLVSNQNWSKEASLLSLKGGEFHDSMQILKKVNELKPELIFSHRNLNSEGWRFSHSLGSQLDVMIQKTSVPVVVMPHPRGLFYERLEGYQYDCVIGLTNHLKGDSNLVSMAASFSRDHGKLILAHLEDEVDFEKYMDAISCISTIDTDMAREKISAQLLKGPHNYIQSCQESLNLVRPLVNIQGVVGFGNHLSDVVNLVREKQAELLVMHTRNDDQLALHGLTYPLTVEMQQIPLLML